MDADDWHVNLLGVYEFCERRQRCGGPEHTGERAATTDLVHPTPSPRLATPDGSCTPNCSGYLAYTSHILTSVSRPPFLLSPWRCKVTSCVSVAWFPRAEGT